MAQEPKGKATEAEAAAAEDAKQDDAADAPLKYHRDRLVAEAPAFFGVPSHVVAGALAVAKTGNKTQFTRDEMQEMLDKFSSHQVAMSGKGA